jgi:hypothetical protein
MSNLPTDATITIRRGEKVPVYGKLTADSGTLTITAASVYLYSGTTDATLLLGPVAATDFDAAPAASREAWYNFDTDDPAGDSSVPALTAGSYTFVIEITCTGSDGEPRIERPAVLIKVV